MRRNYVGLVRRINKEESEAMEEYEMANVG